MAQDWQQWFRQAREQGMSRREVHQYLTDHGHDADQLLDQYWPAQGTGTEQAQPRNAEQRESDLEVGTDGHMDTAITVFSSPSGFFRRIDPSLRDGGTFLAINVVLFLILGTAISSIIGLVTADTSLSQLIIGGITDHLLLAGQLLAGGIALFAYLYLVFGILKGGLTMEQVGVTVLYTSVVLLLAWVPVIGRFITLYGFKTVRQGLEEQLESERHSFTLILAPAGIAAFLGLISTVI